jgi:hypothetical protein
MGPFTFLGYYILIQNVYPLETAPLDPFRQVETWIFVHGYIPAFIRLIMPDLFYSILVCYAWESYEAGWSIVGQIASYFGDNFVSTSSQWLGTEKPTDSLIGDMLQGSMASLWSSYFMWISGLPSYYLWSRRNGKQRLWRVILLLVQSHSSAIATVFFVRDLSEPIYYNSFAEWWNSTPNLYPTCWFVWLAIMFLFNFYMRWEDVDFASKDDPSMVAPVQQYYSYMMIYLSFMGAACSTFVFPTYAAFWVAQLILASLFFWYHCHYIKLPLRTFLPYVSFVYFQDNRNASAVGVIEAAEKSKKEREHYVPWDDE